MARIYFFYLSLFFVMSCQSNTSPSQEIKSDHHYSKDNVEKGRIISKISVRSDSSINYSLYVPQKYDTTRGLPTIFLFDASGRGKFAVTKFANLAEKYGYILIGSNSNKNGLSQDQHNNFSKQILADAQTRFALENGRIYTAGFSGGARVASGLALIGGGIEGVMACSAGFPQIQASFNQNFNFIGVVGNEDFNYSDLKQLDTMLLQTAIPHHLLVFDGKHEWPNENVLEDGIIWFEMNAMKSNKAPRNEALLKIFIAQNEQKIEDFAKLSKAESEVEILEKLINFTTGLWDVTAFKNQLQKIVTSSKYNSWNEKHKQILFQENSKKQELANAFASKDALWWKIKISQIQKSAHLKTDEGLMNKRLLSYIGIISHISYDNAMKQKSTDQALHFLQMKAQTQPDEPVVNFLYASFYTIKGDLAKATEYLLLSEKQGFDDLDRLKTDAGIAGLKQSDVYKKLRNKLETK